MSNSSYKRLEGYEDKIKKGTPESVLKVDTIDLDLFQVLRRDEKLREKV